MKISILDLGAVAGTAALQTEYIQSAIDTCFTNGGGTVIIPKGKFVIGSIRLRSGVTLYLEKGAELIGSRIVDNYTLLRDEDTIEPIPEQFLPEVTTKRTEESHRHWHYALIHIYNAHDVAIIGEEGSTINGSNVYDPEGEENYRGPHAISVLRSKNITMKGYTVIDSSNWAHNCWCCQNLHFEDITVLAGHDGIDFFGSDNVVVKNCKLYSGDDCIAGYDNQHVLITGCIINSSCSGFRFSGTHVVIEKCEILGPGKYIHRDSLSIEEKIQGKNQDYSKSNTYRNNMLGLITYYADNRLPIREYASDIIVRDCVVKSCDRFLLLKYSKDERWQCNKSLVEITFENIKAENVKIPITVKGDREHPISLYVNNCDISFHEDYTNQPLVMCANYDLVSLKGINSNYKGEALIKSFGDLGNVIVEGGNIEEKLSISEDTIENFDIVSI